MTTRIAYIGPAPEPPTAMWGGSQATANALYRAFLGDNDYQLLMADRRHTTAEGVRAHADTGDLLHVDDTLTLEKMFRAGMPPPDVIGPISRSPLKTYSGRNPVYTPDWFYSAGQIIRLNYGEERDHPELVRLVTHGVDTETLQPTMATDRRDIIWAGSTARHAKNHELWLDIIAAPPPPGHRYITMTDYQAESYWAALESAAVYVCTSRSETFCSAAFEAMARGVVVVWRHGLQGGLWEDAGIRCDYTPEAFRSAIVEACALPDMHGATARQYVEDSNTLGHMRDSYAEAYRQAISTKGTAK
jgi:hypothetical protein